MADPNPFVCPECGADVHPNAAGCRACGARKVEGRWESSEIYDGLDLPGEDDFDYNEFLREEFGEGQGRRDPKRIFWTVVAVVVLIALLFLSLTGWW